MSASKVLIVDDSITMRALFTSALERSKNLVVVGAASDAAMAFQMVRDLKPDVITLDIEMPGKNGIEFLRELMASTPMPVVMLSTLTQKGADVTLQAIEIGAVDCFPKPQKATPDEFEKISAKLCALVATAAKTNVNNRRKTGSAPVKVAVDYHWDGSVIAIAAGMGGVDALGQLLAGFPANCPPTIVVMPMEEGLSAPLIAKLDATIAPAVRAAVNMTPIEPGHVYIASDPGRHVAIDRWPEGRIRTVDRDPVNGQRPSADLLFSTVAKTIGAKSDCVILSGGGQDGAGGMAMLRQAGARTFCQTADTALIHEMATAAIARGVVQHQLAPAEMAGALLGVARSQAAAA